MNTYARVLPKRELGVVMPVPLGFSDARVEHLHKNVRIIREFNHQLLVLLHLPKSLFINPEAPKEPAL